MSASEEKKVGYKSPPSHAQFQPGQSGNPRGRPRKPPTIGFEIVAELRQKVTVRENGTEKKLTKAAALAKSLVSRALAGDMRAFAHLVRLLPAQFQVQEEVSSSAGPPLDAGEAAALERFVARRLAATQGQTTAQAADQDQQNSQAIGEDDVK